MLPFLSPKGAAYPSPGHRSCEKIPWKSKSISRRDAKPQRHKENDAVDLSKPLRLGVSARDCLFFFFRREPHYVARHGALSGVSSS